MTYVIQSEQDESGNQPCSPTRFAAPASRAHHKSMPSRPPPTYSFPRRMIAVLTIGSKHYRDGFGWIKCSRALVLSTELKFLLAPSAPYDLQALRKPCRSNLSNKLAKARRTCACLKRSSYRLRNCRASSWTKLI